MRFLHATLLIAIALMLGAVSAHADGSNPKPFASVLGEIRSTWLEVTAAVAGNHLKDVHEKLQRIEALRNEAGVADLEEYSIFLLEQAKIALRGAEKDVDTAAFYTRKALQLSPTSPRVAFHAVQLVGVTGVGSSWRQLLSAVFGLKHSPLILASVLGGLLYPVLWAVTLAAYVVYVFYITFWMPDVLRQVAPYFPIKYRGYATPIATGSFLFIPIFFGPIMCLLCWALLLWLVENKRIWPTLLSGVVIGLWGVLIPIRETMMHWLTEPGTAAMLRVSSGVVGSLDRFELERLVKARPHDGAAWFIYGQLLRKEGSYQLALEAQHEADKWLGPQPWTLEETGIVQLLLGDTEAAKVSLDKAQKLGLKSAEFYYNLSKVSFEELDTASVRSNLSMAERMDPAVMKILKEREQQLGPDHPASFADIHLPVSVLFGSFFQRRQAEADSVAQGIMPGYSSFAFSIIGVSLCALPLFRFRKKKKRERVSAYYGEYVVPQTIVILTRLCPGGSWVIAKRPWLAFLSLAVVLVTLMPLIGWPADARIFLDVFPESILTLGALFAVATLSVSVFSLVSVED